MYVDLSQSMSLFAHSYVWACVHAGYEYHRVVCIRVSYSSTAIHAIPSRLTIISTQTTQRYHTLSVEYLVMRDATTLMQVNQNVVVMSDDRVLLLIACRVKGTDALEVPMENMRDIISKVDLTTSTHSPIIGTAFRRSSNDSLVLRPAPRNCCRSVSLSSPTDNPISDGSSTIAYTFKSYQNVKC